MPDNVHVIKLLREQSRKPARNGGSDLFEYVRAEVELFGKLVPIVSVRLKYNGNNVGQGQNYTVAWVLDNQLSNCMRCNVAFNFFSNRRHHCRTCGYLVCKLCSSNTLLLAPLSTIEGYSRVCQLCRQNPQQAAEQSADHSADIEPFVERRPSSPTRTSSLRPFQKERIDDINAANAALRQAQLEAERLSAQLATDKDQPQPPQLPAQEPSKQSEQQSEKQPESEIIELGKSEPERPSDHNVPQDASEQDDAATHDAPSEPAPPATPAEEEKDSCGSPMLQRDLDMQSLAPTPPDLNRFGSPSLRRDDLLLHVVDTGIWETSSDTSALLNTTAHTTPFTPSMHTPLTATSLHTSSLRPIGEETAETEANDANTTLRFEDEPQKVHEQKEEVEVEYAEEDEDEDEEGGTSPFALRQLDFLGTHSLSEAHLVVVDEARLRRLEAAAEEEFEAEALSGSSDEEEEDEEEVRGYEEDEEEVEEEARKGEGEAVFEGVWSEKEVLEEVAREEAKEVGSRRQSRRLSSNSGKRRLSSKRLSKGVGEEVSGRRVSLRAVNRDGYDNEGEGNGAGEGEVEAVIVNGFFDSPFLASPAHNSSSNKDKDADDDHDDATNGHRRHSSSHRRSNQRIHSHSSKQHIHPDRDDDDSRPRSHRDTQGEGREEVQARLQDDFDAEALN